MDLKVFGIVTQRVAHPQLVQLPGISISVILCTFAIGADQTIASRSFLPVLSLGR